MKHLPMLLALVLPLLSSCATPICPVLLPSPVKAPSPPAAARQACPAPVQDLKSALDVLKAANVVLPTTVVAGTLAADDLIDTANRYQWKTCIIVHTAAQTYINTLIKQGYITGAGP